MVLINRLNQIISEFHLLKHPFYQAWNQGKLSRDVLKQYSIQYYMQVGDFPRFLSYIHAGCDKIDVRKIILRNLIDEELHGKDHPALWQQFATGMGASREDLMNAQPIPETENMVNVFYDLAKRDWRDGLCALYAYEYQVPEVAASKIEGLQKFYGINDDETLEFFVAHQTYDVEHANQVAALIEQYVEPERAELATQEASVALWRFLDGMCREGNIACH